MPRSRILAGRASLHERLLQSTALLLLATSAPAMANPKGGSVVAGDASIEATAPGRLDIRQSTDKAVINWQDFSIQRGERTNFVQPSARSVTLNRVVGKNLSTIAGSLTANGQVILVNRAGIVFTKTAKVDVGGLVATTADIADRDLMAGRLDFDIKGAGDGRVVNEGEISVADGGIAAFVAPWVENAGVIQARLGRVELASASTFTLDLYGDGLIQLALADEAPLARAGNSGLINADGGTVALSAGSAASIVANVVNTGVIEARSFAEHDGRIILSGGEGDVLAQGRLDVSGAAAGQHGGEIVLSAVTVAVDHAALDATGEAGGGEIRIGGGLRGAPPLPQAKPAQLAEVGADATLDASATGSGAGGRITIWGDVAARLDGRASARGGPSGGDGGMIELSSLGAVGLAGLVAADAPAGRDGSFLLDPESITIIPNDQLSNATDQIEDGIIARNDKLTKRVPLGNFRVRSGSVSAVTGTLILEAKDFIELQEDIDMVNLNAGERLVLDAGGELRLNASIRAAGGDIRLVSGANKITVGRDIDIVTPGGNVTFAGAVDGKVAGSERLDVVMGPGTTTFTSSVGGLVPLEALTVNASSLPKNLIPAGANVTGRPGKPLLLRLRADAAPGSPPDGIDPTLLIDGLPIGSVVSDGRSRVVVPESGEIDVSGLDIRRLTLTAPAGSAAVSLAVFRVIAPAGGEGVLVGPTSVAANSFIDGTARDSREAQAGFEVDLTGELGPDTCSVIPDACPGPQPPRFPSTTTPVTTTPTGPTTTTTKTTPAGPTTTTTSTGGGPGDVTELANIEPGAGDTEEVAPDFWEACPDIVTDTTSWHSTAYDAAFNSDPRTTPYSINIFCGGYQLAAPLRGASIDYTGLTFVTRDFWTDYKQATSPELVQELRQLFLGNTAAQ